jgi:hypothetical protein
MNEQQVATLVDDGHELECSGITPLIDVAAFEAPIPKCEGERLGIS